MRTIAATILLLVIVSRASAQPASYYAGCFTGSFAGNTAKRRGVIEIALIRKLQPPAAGGYVNFTQHPGAAPVCAAGAIDGKLLNRRLEASFTSNDVDRGCGFDRNDRFQITATLSENGAQLRGSYFSARGEQGVFIAARTTYFSHAAYAATLPGLLQSKHNGAGVINALRNYLQLKTVQAARKQTLSTWTNLHALPTTQAVTAAWKKTGKLAGDIDTAALRRELDAWRTRLTQQLEQSHTLLVKHRAAPAAAQDEAGATGAAASQQAAWEATLLNLMLRHNTTRRQMRAVQIEILILSAATQ